jgi:hypothetical protein
MRNKIITVALSFILPFIGVLINNQYSMYLVMTAPILWFVAYDMKEK